MQPGVSLAATSSRALIERLVAPPAEPPLVPSTAPPLVPSAVASVEPPIVEEIVVARGDVVACAQCGAALAESDIFCGECGFVRDAVVVAPVRPHDTAAYDPALMSQPLAAELAAEPVPDPDPESDPDPVAHLDPIPEPAASPLRSDYDDELDSGATRIVERGGSGQRFVLQFSTGESVSVNGTGLIGRNPIAEPGEYFDSLVSIVDPGKSVSKTHLEFGQDAGAFWVNDRFSANGTVLREPERPARRGDAGKRYRVVRGTRVDIGEQFFIVS